MDNINEPNRSYEGPLKVLNRQARIGPTTIIKPNNALPLLHMKNLFKAFVVFIFLQYLCFFIGLPFEELQNRPGISIISQLSLVFTVVSSMFILSFSAITVPTKQVYIFNLTCTIFQMINLALSIGSMILLWRLKGNIQIPVYKDNQISTDIPPVDVTLMLRVFSIVLLVINIATSGISITICYLYANGLFRVANGIPRDIKDSESLKLKGEEYESPSAYFERTYGVPGKMEFLSKEIELELNV